MKNQASKPSKRKSQISSISEPIAPFTAQPTTAQLANLAAVLSKSGNEPSSLLVEKALRIWESAHKLLTSPPPPPPVEPEPPSLPQPKSYPVELDTFLNFMLPAYFKSRSGDRYALFREYLKYRLRNPTPPSSPFAEKTYVEQNLFKIPFDCCNPHIVTGIYLPHRKLRFDFDGPRELPPEPTQEDVESRIALWRANPIPDDDSFKYHAYWFRDWYTTAHAAEISEKRRAAGARGHASKKRGTKK
jgi:hypothetical protein